MILLTQALAKMGSYFILSRGVPSVQVGQTSTKVPISNKISNNIPVPPMQQFYNHVCDKLRDNLPTLWNQKCLLLENAYIPLVLEIDGHTLTIEHRKETKKAGQKCTFIEAAQQQGRVHRLDGNYVEGQRILAVKLDDRILSVEESKDIIYLLFPSREDVLDEIINHGKRVTDENGVTRMITPSNRVWQIFPTLSGYYLSQRLLTENGLSAHEVASCWGKETEYAQDIPLSEEEHNKILTGLENPILNIPKNILSKLDYTPDTSLDQKNHELRGSIIYAQPASLEVESLRATRELIFDNVYVGNAAALTQMLNGVYTRTVFNEFWDEEEIAEDPIAFTQVVSAVAMDEDQKALLANKSNPQTKQFTDGVTHLQLNLDETPALKCGLVAALPEVFRMIDKARRINEPILIHCSQGKHRSAFFAAAYLVYTLHITPDDAITFLKKRRALVELRQSGEYPNRPMRPAEEVLWALYRSVTS